MADPKKPNLKIRVDDLFTGGGQLPREVPHGQIVELDISELHDFPNHPFKVRNNEDMRQMAESIKDRGILNPILVRPHKDGGYEVIAGHRRKFACGLVDIEKIPAIIKEFDDDEVVILMVDSNIQRENILPSERAFAYKMKLDAMKNQGKRTDLTSSQVGTKLRTDSVIALESGDSRNQIARYIRLTHLLSELLDMVDDKQIAFNPAVEISYLTKEQQLFLLETIERESTTPSLSQAQRLKQVSKENKLSKDVIYAVLTEEKPNQKEVFKFKPADLAPYVYKTVKPDGYRDYVIKACEFYKKHLERSRDNEAR